ncbi:MAG TPA: SelB C-terminal domain-containing protein, partial [Thermoanaerobaculia bacterium]
RLLGISRGVIAVTKTDRVAEELVAITRSDVSDLVSGSFLEGAPIVPVSSRTGEGLAALQRALVQVAAGDDASARESRGVRLPIDRAFLIAGFGPVVTGSLVSGTISREQKLEILPRRTLVRVRRLEVHGRETAEARAGERVSANLAGVELPELKRGLVLATPGAFATTSLLTVRLELLESAPTLANGSRLSFHHFSSETQARVRILARSELPAGQSGLAQLRLAAPIAAAPGDRFVVRRLSPMETIGGGVVVDPLFPRVSRRTQESLHGALGRLEGALEDRLALWIEQSRELGTSEEELAARAGISREEVRAALAVSLKTGGIEALRRSPDRYAAREALDRLAVAAAEEIRRHVAETPGAVGAPRRTLLARLVPESDPRWAEAVEATLVKRGAYVVDAEIARLPGHEDLGGSDRDLSERIAAVFRRRGLDPPSIAEVAQEVGHKPKVIEGLTGYLTKKGSLVRLPGGWIVARDAVDDVTRRLLATGRKSIDVGEFKEIFGLTRKLAIPLLEHLDATKVTRRVGDKREIIG